MNVSIFLREENKVHLKGQKMDSSASAKIDVCGLGCDLRTRCAVQFTVLFSLLAHVYRWTMAGFSHDALFIYQNDSTWQIALGRFLIRGYLLVRGKMTPPIIIAAFAVAFLSLSIVFIIRILDIRSKVGIIALCGVMATHASLADSYVFYLPWVDVYMLSLLLSVLAVYTFIQFPRRWILSSVLVALSMGLYPTYVQSAVVLCLLWLIKTCVRKEETPFIFKKACLAIAFLMLGGILYYALWRLSLHVFNIQQALVYNSVSEIRHLFNQTPLQIMHLIHDAYMVVIREIFLPFTFHSPLVGCCDTVLCLLAAVSFFRLTEDWKKRLGVFVLILLVPFGSSFVYVLSNGYFSITMRYSIVLYQALVIMMLDLWIFDELLPIQPKLGKAFRIVVPLLYFLIVLNNSIYSNQVYLKASLEEQATLSVMTRLLTRMEETEGYIPGETVVVLEGDVNNSRISQIRPGYPTENITYAMTSSFAPQYHGAYRNYFRNVLGYPIQLGSLQLTDLYKTDPRVISMAAFPDADCCKMIDGMLIVKLSEDMYIYHDYILDAPKAN